MKWYAIMRPDGSFIMPSVDNTKAGAWYLSEGCDEELDKAAHGMRRDALVRRGEIAGYRCVEVQLVEPGTAEALEKARKAWGSLAGVGASVGVYNPGSGCARIVEDAMQVLEEVLGEVDSTAPTGGAESKEGV